MTVEKCSGALYAMGSLISYKNKQLAGAPFPSEGAWPNLIAAVVKLLGNTTFLYKSTLCEL